MKDIKKSAERIKVIDNIKKSIKNNQFNNKVELGDHVVSQEERQNIVMEFDTLREKASNKIKRTAALKLANEFTKIYNKNTQIIGMENLEGINSGAIITANHFNPADSTAIRYMTNKINKTSELDIVVEEENIFMTGEFGKLMNYCNTIPLSKSDLYMRHKFFPAIEKFLNEKHWILIFPEEEMWFNYKKPRPLKDGAYHLAAKYNVPIIPTFIAMYEREGEYDQNGFNKVDFKLHIMKPLYPDTSKSIKKQKEELRNKDYEFKVKAYEEAYSKKLDYTFKNWDIAGYDTI